jgi:hypothetical protein
MSLIIERCMVKVIELARGLGKPIDLIKPLP